jgi:DNA-binding NarL/FixJ family response regulator
MTFNCIDGIWHYRDEETSQLDELDHALSSCWDLSQLQMSSLIQLPSITEKIPDESDALELAKALRKELISCAEQLTQRYVYPIEEIVAAIENGQLGIGSQNLARIKRDLGIPFPRHKMDLARYYAIRLLMEGLDQQRIAEFLEVDPRTVASYVFQAKERINLVLESQPNLVEVYASHRIR